MIDMLIAMIAVMMIDDCDDCDDDWMMIDNCDDWMAGNYWLPWINERIECIADETISFSMNCLTSSTKSSFLVAFLSLVQEKKTKRRVHVRTAVLLSFMIAIRRDSSC